MSVRRRWLAAVSAFAAVLWLATVDSLLNLTAGAWNLAGLRWILLSAAVVITISTGIFAAITEYRSSTRESAVSREERFNRGVEQLGSDRPEMGLAGVRTLAAIAAEAVEERPTIAGILAAHVRGNALWPVANSILGNSTENTPPSMLPLFPELKVRAPVVHEALAVLVNGTFRSVDLSHTDLRRANLASGNLQEADLRGANLRGADLSGANLSSADLRLADLTAANMAGVRLAGARLAEAHLSEIDLTTVDLSSVDLVKVDLSGSDLHGVDLNGRAMHFVNMRRANLSGANLSGAQLPGANMSRASMVTTDLSYAHMPRANLEKANMRGACLRYADIHKAFLSGAYLVDTDLRDASMEEADVAGARFIGTDLRGACLFEVNLDQAGEVKNVRADGTTMWPEGLSSSRWTVDIQMDDDSELEPLDE